MEVAVLVIVDVVIRDRPKYDQAGDPRHLEDERSFEREVRKKGEPDRFSYDGEDVQAADLEEQRTILLREDETDAEPQSPHAPEEPGADDEACPPCALGCMGAATGKGGELLFG